MGNPCARKKELDRKVDFSLAHLGSYHFQRLCGIVQLAYPVVMCHTTCQWGSWHKSPPHPPGTALGKHLDQLSIWCTNYYYVYAASSVEQLMHKSAHLISLSQLLLLVLIN